MAKKEDVSIKGVDGEVFKLVVQTEHKISSGKVLANTAVHDQLFARRIGGVRFRKVAPPGNGEPENLRELGELAQAMTWKSPLSGLMADGEKTVVYCPDGLPSKDEMASILSLHLKELIAADRGVIFGPDIDCNEEVMQSLADSYNAGDHVSGLLRGKGGLSIDGQGYTAQGLEAALVAAAGRLRWNLSGMKAVFHGFGAVGAHTGRNLRKHGVILHAVSTAHGNLIAETAEGLEVEELFNDWKEWWKKGRPGEAFKRFLESPPRGARIATNEEFWKEKADIFIPAALADVLALRQELPEVRLSNIDVRGVEDFFEDTGIRIVVEGANHPLTYGAENYLEAHGVLVLPDYLVNCGGLIGCWADWVYRRELQSKDESGIAWYDRLNESVPRYVSETVGQNVPKVLDITGNRPKGMRKASYELAKRLREDLAVEFRGYAESNGHDHDGRTFARLRMGKLLG